MQINPTILTDDQNDYLRQLSRDSSFAKEIDIDVIDWDRTERKTLSAGEALDNSVVCALNFDLMMDFPLAALKPILADKRVRRVIINIASKEELLPLLLKIKNAGKLRGISFSDPRDYGKLKKYFRVVDSIHIFTIQPGAQGNAFRPEMLEYAKTIKEDGFTGVIGIDGGVNIDTLSTICEYPIDIAVVGSAISKAAAPDKVYAELVRKVEQLLGK